MKKDAEKDRKYQKQLEELRRKAEEAMQCEREEFERAEDRFSLAEDEGVEDVLDDL